MKIAPFPADENERLAALSKHGILDTEPEAAFDSMVQLASYICQTPIAAISLVDEHRQWFKAITGLAAKETPRDVAFCAHAILGDEPLIVPDARRDERFHDNPLVASDPEICFYAGIPLVTSEGYHLGTLCVIDRRPRVLEPEQLSAIKVLADSVIAHLDLRLSHRKIRQYVENLQLAASIFESSSESMVVTDTENRIVTVNPAFTATTGYTLGEVIGKNPKLLSSGRQSPEFYREMWRLLDTTGHWSGELWNRRKNGEIYAEWLSINVIFNDDGSKRMHLAIFSDITQKKQADELIWKYANYDHLTQLPNRRLFRDRLDQEIRMATRSRHALALVYIDLDHFKEINDTLGHDVGDRVLEEVSRRIKACVRDSDTVARWGGDEFTAILSPLGNGDVAGRVPEAVIQSLAQPFITDGHTLSLSASIGIAFYPADGGDAAVLLCHADQAMYEAKRQGRNRYWYYQPKR